MASRSFANACFRRAPKHASKTQVRWLTLHEYQSQGLLREYNVPTPRGGVAKTTEEAKAIAQKIGGNAIIRPQILRRQPGKGRFDSGLSGGVQIVGSPEECEAIAKKMLGHTLQSTETKDRGVKVEQIYVSEIAALCDEWYIAMTVDRELYCPVILLSKVGGSSFEDIKRTDPDSIKKYPMKASEGITTDILSQISSDLGVQPSETIELENILCAMHKIFTEKDATHLEINPLARLPDGSLTCVSTNFTFDDAAGKRQPDLFALRDVNHEVPEEVEAEKHGLVYVKMDGNIGNVVNGAGLAMATNDAIGLYGGASANFLDAGGQATKQTMLQAFAIIMRDERVKAILVNIYGGITDGVMIAESIIGAASELGPLRVPVVVRLQGTNSAEGLKLLEEADLGLYVEADFGEAAKKAVELAAAAPK